MRTSMRWLAFASGCAVVTLATAQTEAVPRPLDPSPPHERLGMFEGTWTTADSTSEDGFREHCAWLSEGRRHMVCKSRWNTPSGPREGLSVFSYDNATGDYVYNGFRAGGSHVIQRGSQQGGRWHFHSERGNGADRLRSRITIEPTDSGFTFLSETSKGDEPFRAGARVEYVRLAR
jgi:hypothetical protein